MAEKRTETVSALVDNHQIDTLDTQGIFEDTELSEQWSRYHLIGDVMRDEAGPAIHLDLSDQIAQAIADEPTVLAPHSTGWLQRAKANVVPLFKQAGQFAVAATVTGVMILGVQAYNQGNDTTDIPSPAIVTNPLVGAASPVSLQTSQDNGAAIRRAEQRQRLNAYMLDHEHQLRLQGRKNQNQDEQNQSEQETP